MTRIQFVTKEKKDALLQNFPFYNKMNFAITQEIFVISAEKLQFYDKNCRFNNQSERFSPRIIADSGTKHKTKHAFHIFIEYD